MLPDTGRSCERGITWVLIEARFKGRSHRADTSAVVRLADCRQGVDRINQAEEGLLGDSKKSVVGLDCNAGAATAELFEDAPRSREQSNPYTHAGVSRRA
jgi:hypothetical protein